MGPQLNDNNKILALALSLGPKERLKAQVTMTIQSNIVMGEKCFCAGT
jgi:hypothetical protein